MRMSVIMGCVLVPFSTTRLWWELFVNGLARALMGGGSHHEQPGQVTAFLAFETSVRGTVVSWGGGSLVPA
jgi:hypothetical protein